jgi:hypothetical protein
MFVYHLCESIELAILLRLTKSINYSFNGDECRLP